MTDVTGLWSGMSLYRRHVGKSTDNNQYGVLACESAAQNHECKSDVIKRLCLKAGRIRYKIGSCGHMQCEPVDSGDPQFVKPATL